MQRVFPRKLRIRTYTFLVGGRGRPLASPLHLLVGRPGESAIQRKTGRLGLLDDVSMPLKLVCQ